MSYFEFNDGFGYYALIGALTEEDAMIHYQQIVADIDDEGAYPVEISEGEATEKFEKANPTVEDWVEFKDNRLGSEPFIILMDGSLN